MTFDFTGLTVMANSETEKKAAKLFCDEIELRSGKRPLIGQSDVCIKFTIDDSDKDAYSLSLRDGVLTVSAGGIRGFIYGYSMFLRKTLYSDGKIILIKDISGKYLPDKSIRGHQLGYRTTSNTYEAWGLPEYKICYLDQMMFGTNIVEHIPGRAEKGKNDLMKYDADELCILASELADEFDLDVSLWYPNDELPLEETVEKRREFFKKCPRLNVVFPPGGDPGEFPGDVFVDRIKAISKALHEEKPEAQMWPSAQAPHSQPTWGEDFIRKMNELPDEIDGVITGPNRAFPLNVLRRKLPSKYPIRLYPDITHNVRCEYPVHFLSDDWHYSLTTALSRESINPRPREYSLIHKMTRRYIVGSVSYSEGVNDDVNKAVWSNLDFFPEVSLRETLLDYARAFIWQAPAERIADAVFGLERNWEGDPSENPCIEATYNNLIDLYNSIPALSDNWRFLQLLFRSVCDILVKKRRLFETELLENAVYLLDKKCDIDGAIEILSTPIYSEYNELREFIEVLGKKLYDMIGMQLDVERYYADNWERGATLDTIDLPITDKEYYINRLNFAKTLPENEQKAFVFGLLNRNKVSSDEFYYSFAEHGLDVLEERQVPDFYMDFQGDRPNVNNGSIPMCQLKLYDHYSFRCKLSGMTPGKDYKLRVSYSSRKSAEATDHTVTVSGKVIYSGTQYGGEKDEVFDNCYLAPNTETATYIIPAELFTNGCADLVIEEPHVGIMMSEFWVLRA